MISTDTNHQQETIAAQATGGGEAAIAVIRVSGPLVPGLVSAIYHSPPPPPRKFARGKYRNVRGEVLDDTLHCRFPAPRSYTGEDVLEISCHGNPLIARSILRDLSARGCRLAEPGEFTRRAFLNGRMDLSQAEAVIDIIRARGDRALQVARHQLQGGLGKRVKEFIHELLEILAGLEAYIDFPEEDLPVEDPEGPVKRIQRLDTAVARLIKTARYGALLREGARVLIIGAPNAGKSSLLNRLAGHDRVLVSNQPGTTRDAVEERIPVGDHCIRIMDTAGLRSHGDQLETMGMRKTLEYAEEADFFLLLLDATLPHPALPVSLPGLLTPDNTLVVHNKIDLLPNQTVQPWGSDFKQISLSALTGEGLDDLEAAMNDLIEATNPVAAEEFVVIGARHAEALETASVSLEESHSLLLNHEPTELAVSHLRTALHHFGEITGQVDNEAMLDRLFANFCIGK